MPDDIAAKVSAVIAADVAAGKKAGPFNTPPFHNLFISPIGAVPKKGSDKVRVIHNLSYPFKGESVNHGIEEMRLKLDSFDTAANAVVKFFINEKIRCLLIKLDVEAAYKQVAVHPDDRHLLGFMWQGKYYYERVLPFGLKSSCRLWDLFAEALHYLFNHILGIPVVVHYVDDFLFVVPINDTVGAQQLLANALAMCEELGVPMAADKTEGPITDLVFLGIKLDTERMEASLPPKRLIELQQLACEWVKKERATIKELQSLTGLLNFACKVIRPGRYFLRRIIDHTARMLKHLKDPHSFARWIIPPVVKEDIIWWLTFVDKWNGISLLYDDAWTSSNADIIRLTTDACQTGYGAMWRDQWFAGQWNVDQLAMAQRKKRVSMPYLELHALVQAAATWGHHWRGKKICFMTDCEVNVHCIERQRSSDSASMHLLRQLCMIAAKHGFDFKAKHIEGLTNVAADRLSRNAMSEFRVLFPHAQQQPVEMVSIDLGKATAVNTDQIEEEMRDTYHHRRPQHFNSHQSH